MTNEEIKDNYGIEPICLFKHTQTGEVLRLIKLRKSEINTFLVVDKQGVPEIFLRSWSTHPSEQPRLIRGFNNLIKYQECLRLEIK